MIERETGRIRAHFDHLHRIEQKRGIEGRLRMGFTESDAPAMASLVACARSRAESFRRRQNQAQEQAAEGQA